MNRQNLSSLILIFLFLLSLLSVVGLAKDGPGAASAPSLRDTHRSTSPSTPDAATGAHTRSLVAEVVDVAAQAAGSPGQTVDKASDPQRPLPQGFRLEPEITVAPDPIQKTLPWAATGSLPSVMTNHMGIDYPFQLVELDVVEATPPDQVEILLLGAGVADDPAGWTVYRQALTAAGMSWEEWNLDIRSFPTAAELAPYSILIVFAESVPAFDDGHCQILADWLLAGEKRLFANGVDWLWNLWEGAPGQGRNALYQLFRTEFEGTDAGRDILALEGVAGDVIGGDFELPHVLALSLTADSNGNYADQSQGAAVAALLYGAGGVGTEFAGLTHYDGGIYRTVWLGVNFHNGLIDPEQRNRLMANVLDFFLSVDLPWYGASITGGLAPAGEDVGWTNHFTASVDAGVDQPGDYLGRLGILPDSEQVADLPTKEVDIVLTVLPAPSMGRLEGMVSCERTGGPLSAELTFENAVGVTWTTSTDPGVGSYEYWLDEGTYQLSASAMGYLSETAQVQVTAGQTTTQDLVLALLAPRIEVAPSSLEQILEIDAVTSDTLVISNTGPLSLTFSLGHSLADRIPRAADAAVWLAADPVSGTVAPAQSLEVEVTFDAATVAQPGSYWANLYILSDDPMASEITVPVTMTVLPGPEMGRLEGTLQGLGYCDAEAFPLEADLTVHSEAGMSTSLHSAADTGWYGLWLPVGTYTVTANAAQHVGAAASVAVVTGMTATLNFDLRWNESCMDIEPLSFSVTLAPDEQRMETVSLANLGAGALAWELRETTAVPPLRATGAESWPVDIAPGTTFGPVLLDEGFEGGQVPPPGWSLVQTNERQTWVLSDSACEGDHAAVCDYDEQFGLQDEVLLTPAMALAAGTLTFQSSGSLYWCRDTLDNCDLNVWLVTGDWDGGLDDDIYVGRADDDWLTSGKCFTSSFDLDPLLPGGPVRVGFQYYGRNGGTIGLDAIRLEGVEPGTWGDVPWVSVAPASGTVAGDGQTETEVLLDATGLTAGMCYTASLGLLHGDPGWENPVYLPLQLCVASPSAAEGRRYLPLVVKMR